jgi:hypothetical protein
MVMLKGFEKEVEVDSRKHKVKVIDGSAKLQKTKSGKILLKIRITAEIDEKQESPRRGMRNLRDALRRIVKLEKRGYVHSG